MLTAINNLVFFSGGTATSKLAYSLSTKTSYCTYIMSTFDSGGSSAALRTEFTIPALGDIRSRLISIANKDNLEIQQLCSFLSHRFAQTANGGDLQKEYELFCNGKHPLMAGLSFEKKHFFEALLQGLQQQLSHKFSLSNASVGNLVLCALYLQKKSLHKAIKDLHSLLECRGEVLALTEEYAHLAVRLKSGQIIVGQDRFTGKSEEAIQSPISKIWLSESYIDAIPKICTSSDEVQAKISNAACLIFAPGSFYSSVITHLLVQGVLQSIEHANCPKVFIPNLGADPELYGHSLEKQLLRFLSFTDKDNNKILSHILLDTHYYQQYQEEIPHALLKKEGISLRVEDISLSDNKNLHDEHKLAQCILSFVR